MCDTIVITKMQQTNIKWCKKGNVLFVKNKIVIFHQKKKILHSK